MTTPLLAGYTICGEALPERFLPQDAPPSAFRLPGADALAAFSDLIGGDPLPAENAQTLQQNAPFPLPALLPEDVTGCVTLEREVALDTLSCRQALLVFDMLCGRGEVVLTSLPPRFPRRGMPQPEPVSLCAAFDNGPLMLDVTALLAQCRRFSLRLHFSEARPAGVCGSIFLRTAEDAYIASLMLEPSAARQTVTVHAAVAALKTGEYLLHAQGCPVSAPAPQEAQPLYERPVQLAAGETRTIRLSLNMPGEPFVPGKAYASPAVKLWLYRKTGPKTAPLLCDSLAQPFGYPGPRPDCFLPLTAADCRRPPGELARQLLALHAPAVSLPAAAPDLLYSSLTRSSIAVRQSHGLPDSEKLRLMRHACVTFGDAFSPDERETAEPAVSAWQLCGLLSCPREPEPGLTPAQLLAEAAGRALDPASPAVQEVLQWLRAFRVRLHAEAFRHKNASGALCAPGEWAQEDVADALRTALAPLHLSALPLCGAWWAGSHFSAALRAFIPEGRFAQGTALRAEAALEDAQGGVLARHTAACPACGGPVGLIGAVLPENPCVLELVTRLYADDEIVEESTQPVYVGVRGALESAFSACAEESPC